MVGGWRGGGKVEGHRASEHQRYKRIPEVPLVLALLEPPPECCSGANDYLRMHTIREREKGWRETQRVCVHSADDSLLFP